MSPSPFDLIQQLPAEEQLRLVVQIWDHLGESKEPVKLPEWHEFEASRRLAELEASPDLAIDRQELWKRVRGD